MAAPTIRYDVTTPFNTNLTLTTNASPVKLEVVRSYGPPSAVSNRPFRSV